MEYIVFKALRLGLKCIHSVVGIVRHWPNGSFIVRRYGVALVGIKQNIPNASIQLNPGSRHMMKVTDICFYMSITKEENSAFILAHPNEDKEGLFTRAGSIKALARAGSYRYSKVTSIVATVGTNARLCSSA